MSRRRLAGRLLAAALVLAALLFLGRTIASNAGRLRDFDWQLDPALLIASLVAHVLVLAWGVVVWHRVILLTTHQRIGLLKLQRIWFTSAIARYIPGKIWQLAAAAQMAAREGLHGAAVLTSMTIHIGFTLLAAGLVSAATLAPPDDWNLSRPLLIGVAGIAALLLSHPLVIRSGLALIPRALHRDVIAWSGSWRDGIVLLALSVVSWLLYGGAFWLFVTALVATPPSTLLALAGVNALSFLAGYVVFIAPAGLGARELAMTGLLSGLVPAYVASAVSILSRLWTIAAELLGAALFAVLARARRTDPPAQGRPGRAIGS